MLQLRRAAVLALLFASGPGVAAAQAAPAGPDATAPASPPPASPAPTPQPVAPAPQPASPPPPSSPPPYATQPAYPAQPAPQPAPRLVPLESPPQTPGATNAPVDDDQPRPYMTMTLGLFYYEIFGAGYGLTLGAHILPKTVIEIDAYRSEALAPTQSSSTVAIRLQQFASDHFYFRAGPRLRQLELTSLLDNYSYDYEERLRQTDLGLDVAGGARWDNQNFVFGVDIIGAYVPLVSLFTEQQVIDKRNGELLVADPQDLRARWDVRLGYIYIGARF